MKFVLASLMLSLAATLSAEENAPAPQAPVIQPAYIGKAYTFSGTVETQSGDHKSTTKFAGKTSADSFEITWEMIGLDGMKGSVSVDKNGGILRMAGLPDQKITTPEMAIGAATGISSGAAHVMYNLWKGNNQVVFPTGDLKITKNGEATEYSGSSRSGTTVVMMKDKVIQSVTTTYQPEKMKLVKPVELTDKDITEVLKMMGKPETQEEVDKMRTMLKDAEESSKDQKDPTTWITKFTIEGVTP